MNDIMFLLIKWKKNPSENHNSVSFCSILNSNNTGMIFLCDFDPKLIGLQKLNGLATQNKIFDRLKSTLFERKYFCKP